MKRGAVILALVLLASCAKAEETWTWEKEYGGCGRDRITEAVSVEGGFFAVGQTTCLDDALKINRQSDEAGWALRIGERGDVLFSTSAEHDGRNRMEAPFLHENGVLSCVLTDEKNGLEWLWLDEKGGLLAQMEMPETFCAHGIKALSGRPFDRDGRPMLALLADHGDGTFCCSSMDEYGMVSPGASFEGVKDALFCGDAQGRMVLAGAEAGELHLLFVIPGRKEAVETVSVSLPETRALRLSDMIPAGDGSMLLCGRADKGGFVVRIGADGTLLFDRQTDADAKQLAATADGFAASFGNKVVYFDEDGGLWGESLFQGTDPAAALVGLEGGAALIENTAGNDVLVHASAMQESGQKPEEQLRFAEAGSRILAAELQGEDILLLLEQEDGQRRQVRVDPAGTVYEMKPTLFEAEKNTFILPDGVLSWQPMPGGTQVSFQDAQGNLRWQTGLRIHTAADELEWFCAAPAEDGGVLLGGRCLTHTPEGGEQAGVLAHLNADGILMGMSALDNAGCVSAIWPSGKHSLLLAASGSKAGDDVNRAACLEGPRAVFAGRLDRNLEKAGAYLFWTENGLYAAGTTQSEAGQTAVLFSVPMRQ